jgi:hypothetical protein
MNKKILLLAAALGLFASCKKSHTPDPELLLPKW